MLARVRSNFFIRFTRARCQRRKSLKYWNKGELAQLNTKSGLNIKRQCRNSSHIPGGEDGGGGYAGWCVGCGRTPFNC